MSRKSLNYSSILFKWCLNSSHKRANFCSWNQPYFTFLHNFLNPKRALKKISMFTTTHYNYFFFTKYADKLKFDELSFLWSSTIVLYLDSFGDLIGLYHFTHQSTPSHTHPHPITKGLYHFTHPSTSSHTHPHQIISTHAHPHPVTQLHPSTPTHKNALNSHIHQ